LLAAGVLTFVNAQQVPPENATQLGPIELDWEFSAAAIAGRALAKNELTYG
jgi:hypothetical protein